MQLFESEYFQDSFFFLKVLTSPSWGKWLTHFFPSHNLEVVFWLHTHLIHPKPQKMFMMSHIKVYKNLKVLLPLPPK